MAIVLKRKKYLDGWRGISIILVLVGHFTGFPALKWGTLGVSFFFALSGRLMGEIIFVQKFPIMEFLIRRFSRVWPVLFVFICVMGMSSKSTLIFGKPFPISVAFAALTFTYNYAHSFGVGWFAFDHLWSLCIEEHSYLMLISIAAIAGRNIRRSSFILTIVTILSIADGLLRSLWLHQDYYHTYWASDASLHFVTAPSLIFLWRERIISWLGPRVAYAAPFFAALGLAANYHRVPFYVTGTVTPFFLGGAVVLLPHTKRSIILLLQNKILTSMGLWSYSIYIWQQPLMVAAVGHSSTIRFGLLMISVCVGILSYYVIEHPARLFINGRLASRASVGSVKWSRVRH